MIELNVEQIDQAERMLGHIPGAAPKAMANAINRAADSARTEAARKVRETYYITHKDVINTIKIYRATSSDPSAMVLSRGSVMALPKFRVTPKRPQPKRKAAVVVRVKRGEGGPIKKAFVARMKSGHIGVFKRAGKSRFPIDQMYGPSVPQMLGAPRVSAWVEEKAADRLDQRLDHEIKRILEAKE
ncbi:phage tail protein [Brevibacillus sp. H7]|uniref:phage tail protein n=1 Tax=Brevibacillus sp. H7 TaxID=3349138 RepID=UPI00382523A5